MSAPPYPFTRTVPLAPPLVLGALRARAPVSMVTMPDGRPAWLVTSHAEARAVLADRRFSSDSEHPGYPSVFDGYPGEKLNLVRMDDPKHGVLRRALAPGFLAESVDRLRPEIQRIVDERIDHLLGLVPPVDFVREFALWVPLRVISVLLGVPPDEWELFEKPGKLLTLRRASIEGVRHAHEEVFEYARSLVDRKEREPGDDLITRNIDSRVRTGVITRDELAGLVRTVLLAGHVTTSNMMALSVISLITEPDRYRSVAEHPETIGAVVEELLRYHSVAHLGMLRVATEDVRIGGVLIRAGEGVVVSLTAADRDPAVFPDPDTLDFGRDARAHIAFGHGPHLCVGREIARAELRVALVSLARRVPDLRLAVPLTEIRFRDTATIYGVDELPVTW